MTLTAEQRAHRTETMRAWRAANPERARANNRAGTKRFREQNPERYREHCRRARLKKAFGISIEEYEALLAAQGGKCATCDSTEADSRGWRLHTDHDHATGRIRGLLCGPCNRAIGLLNDDAERFAALAQYLSDK